MLNNYILNEKLILPNNQQFNENITNNNTIQQQQQLQQQQYIQPQLQQMYQDQIILHIIQPTKINIEKIKMLENNHNYKEISNIYLNQE